MRQVFLIMVFLGFLSGCATFEKDAIEKGYAIPNPAYSTTGWVVAIAAYSATKGVTGPTPAPKLIWNEQLLRQNYPECYTKNANGLYDGWHLPLYCVNEKVEQEGRWR
jgi:hypothetical protein